MDYRKDFIIHHHGLSVGNHNYDFEVDERFFELFEYSQLKAGKVEVELELDKQERMMVFMFHFNGEVVVNCDRCGEEFRMPLSGHEHLIVKLGTEYQEENDDIIVIPSQDSKFDVAPFIYEYLHLLLPAKIVHPDNVEGNPGCNPEILHKLEELSPHPATDPRWEALSQLKQTGKVKPGKTDKQ